ncbi:MAG: diaminopimelate epimerase [Pseudomonadota bacterium]
MTWVPDTGLPFMKMHGLGNDFVVLDARADPIALSSGLVRGIADRNRGIGCDQLAIIGQNGAGLHLKFYNQDGSEAAACGNATRCIARYLMAENGADTLALTTGRGQLVARRAGDHVSVNMGPPQLAWQDIPLAEEMDTLELPIEGHPTATGMGNPHCTFFVPDAEAVDMQSLGPEIETHPLFPARTNVQVAQVLSCDSLRVRVWERGVGMTLASGSSSCAVAVAAARRGLTGRRVQVVLDGGTLDIDWQDDGVWMTGPTEHVADGVLTPAFLAARA